MLQRPPAWRVSLYEAVRNPVRIGQGTPYFCTQQDIDSATHYGANSRVQYKTPNEASNQLWNWLDLSKDPDELTMAALERLWHCTRLSSGTWGPDLVIKAFKDLDRAFFNCTLLGNVRVMWLTRTEWSLTLSRHGESTIDILALTVVSGYAQCDIFLNAQDLLLDEDVTPNPFISVFQTLLHEMCVSRKVS